MKKLLSLVLVCAMTIALVGCGQKAERVDNGSGSDKSSAKKIGAILLGDETEGYTLAHINGIKEAAKELGISDSDIVWKYNISESDEVSKAADQLVAQGCKLIISNSYGHQDYMYAAAQKYTDVDFVAMTGDYAAISGCDNFYNSFTKVYESRYVSGVVAGMKIAELVKEDKIPATGYDADGNVIVKANHMITPKRAAAIIATGVDKVKIRTILTCKSHVGVCAKCYGANMATGQRVQVGEAVGIIAAQSIGEPGTQLTMRTFHSGGVAGDDITQGLPRVEELFEARKPKGLAIIAEFGGRAEIKETRKKREVVVTNEETGESKAYLIPYGSRIKILDGTMLEAGDELTEGSINPHDLLKIKGLRAVQDYMIREVQRVYRLQGVEINDKHVEVIVRQMLKKIKVDTAGDSEFLPGTTVEVLNFNEVNEELEAQGKEPATGTQIMLGITKASLATNSFLSAASFQETTRVLTEAAISGKVDPLVGIKENVLIGKLIPAGTGIERYRSVKLSTDKNQVSEDEEVLSVSEDEEVLAVSEDTEGNETLEVSETIEVTEE